MAEPLMEGLKAAPAARLLSLGISSQRLNSLTATQHWPHSSESPAAPPAPASFRHCPQALRKGSSLTESCLTASESRQHTQSSWTPYQEQTLSPSIYCEKEIAHPSPNEDGRWERKTKKADGWKTQKERKAGSCMPLTITFPVFFTLSYVMVLMVKDAEKSLQLLQLFISKKTEKRIIINMSI